MALKGVITINDDQIANWKAVRAGTAGRDDFIYRCTVEWRDMRGYRQRRRFFVLHKIGDGALALAGKVMIECGAQEREHTDAVAWHNFCERYAINPYALLD